MLLSRDQQLDQLRQTGRGNLLEYAGTGSLALAAALVIAGWYLDWVALYVIAIVVGIVAVTTFTTMSNVRNAYVGERRGARTRGHVQITVTPGAETTSYSAAVRERGERWSFEFVPIEWQPVAGEREAQVVHLKGVDWPVLVIVDDGILVPRYKPKRT